LVAEINTLLAGQAQCREWSLGRTEQRRKEMHIIPLIIHTEQ